MALVIRTAIQMRFADVDSFGHVNNVAQQNYFDVGKTELFRELWRRTGALEPIPAIIVSLHTDFREQILYGDDIVVVTEVESIGTKSLTLCQCIMRGEQLCTRSRTVMVCYDSEQRQSVEVPDAWREILK